MCVNNSNYLFIEPNDLDPLNHEATEVMRVNKTNFAKFLTKIF